LLAAAGTRRALVLSVAYQFGNPNRPVVEDEYTKVRAENDWTSKQVAPFPDRLRGFCGFNPLRQYALRELSRCAGDPHLRYGIKLHFGNSDVNLDDPEHVEKLRRVFREATGAEWRLRFTCGPQ
jgi:predicted TIM-barrel fold metal-dependent hydrolase